MSHDYEKMMLNPEIHHKEDARRNLRKICAEVVKESGSIRTEMLELDYMVRVAKWKAEEVLKQTEVNAIIAEFDHRVQKVLKPDRQADRI